MASKEEFMIVYDMIREGRYNMFSAEARIKSGLPTAIFRDILSNYGKYKSMFIKE